ncbi:MAG: aspartate aminotransferase family protein [Gammaproteobacteria bacterium]|nr:aspartate aminotransferase family protein [Gammaproteobacteria bacterium]
MSATPKERSAALFQRASKVLAGGSTRLTTYFSPHPLYAQSGRASRVTDADGVERVDLLNNYMTLIHGHAHPDVIDAITDQAQRGTCFGMPTEGEIALAEIICERVKSVENIRFCNSGSEAVLIAIKAARAYTDRPMIAKCEGAYHGAYDSVEVSLSSNPDNWGESDEPARVPYTRGLPQRVMDDVVVMPFNDIATSKRLLEANANSLAAIVVDPVPPRVGCVPMQHEYAQMLRDVATKHGIVLIFDEVASFRVHYHGAQAIVGVEPDLTTFGKIIGGGMPVGAVGGNREVMSVFDPTTRAPLAAHGGTFNGNPMTMAAGAASMNLLTRDAMDELNSVGDHARSRINAAFERAGVEGQATGIGSLVKIHMNRRTLVNHRDVYADARESQLLTQLHRGLLEKGFILGSACLSAISTANTTEEIDDLATAVEEISVGLRLNDPQRASTTQ